MGGWETIWPPATREVARLLGGTEQRLRDCYQVQKFVSYWKTIVYYCKIIKMTEVERCCEGRVDAQLFYLTGRLQDY